MPMRPILSLLVVAALLTACERKADDEIDQEALDEIALAIEAELNGPPQAMVALLRSASEAAQVGGDALVVGFDGVNHPVDWWLYRHGYVQLQGLLSVGRPAFGLTQKGRDEMARGDPVWFSAEVGEPSRVDCATPDAVAVAGCEVELPVTPALTDAGRAALGEAQLQPFNLLAIVSQGEEGTWVVNDYRGEGLPPADVALAAILGPEEGRIAARAAALDEINGRLALTPDGQRMTGQPDRYVPPPIEEGPAVAPVTGEGPLGLDLPKRGGRLE